MKKKVLLSSICTIALCLCLIAGSTFALFTSQSDVNITVTAGDVDVVAGIEITKLESVKGDENGTITDEYGSTYSYEEVSPTFTNGGEATVTEGLLTLTEVTPGDKVTFTVTGSNLSTVATQIRYIVTCEDGYTLMSGLVLHTQDGAYESVDSYTSIWEPVAKGTDFVKTFSLELPVDRGNLYEKQSTNIRILVEAVQGNAVVDGNTEPVVEYIQQVSTDAAAMNAAMADPDVTHFIFVEDMTYTFDMPVANKFIDANGKDVQLTFTNTIENVVISNIVETEGGNSINVTGATGNITITDSKLISSGSTSGSAILTGPKANITVENCTFTRAEGKTYGIYYSGASGAVTVKNSVFTGYTSWAIQINSAITGDVTISGCTFDGPDGVFKCLSGISGDFTFTNNTMIGVKGHDGKGVIISATCGGTETVTGNTLDGADWSK